jgi:hypothetical protein
MNNYYLAQTTTTPPATPFFSPWLGKVLMGTSVVLAIALGITYLKYQKEQKEHQKAIRLEKYKVKDLQKKLKLALKTIQKMEKNPDLVHSREFNLDYLRLRMDEEVFHYAVLNQLKVRIKQLVAAALRPDTGVETSVGIANTSGRQVDETFDVTYETQHKSGQRIKGVLFRINIKLTKLPTQSTTTTISQLIDCIEKFLNPSEDLQNWQPAVQGRVVIMHWDQKAKPTPLLILEQTSEGGNVSFRTDPNRRINVYR